MGSSPSSAPPTHRSGEEEGSHLPSAILQSTAQANLRRILAIISTVPPPPPPLPNAFVSEFGAPPPDPPPGEAGEDIPFPSARSDGEGMLVDLRLRLAPAWEIGREGWLGEEDHDAGLLSSACSVVGEETMNIVPKTAGSEIVSRSLRGACDFGVVAANSSSGRSSEGECDGLGAENGSAEDEEVKEVRGGKDEDDDEGKPYSEITNVRGNASREEEESNDNSEEGRRCRRRWRGNMTGEKKSKDGTVRSEEEKRCRRGDEGYLGLLLEAVRQVSGELFGIDEEEKGGAEKAEKEKRANEGKEKGTCCPSSAAALEPVVRSKRGRTQVLPSRYRDSVLEPWWKQSPGAGGGPHHLQRRQARVAR